MAPERSEAERDSDREASFEALAAGFFYTYQISIVRGLMEVDDVTYVKAFQAFNATIRNPWFAAVFFGSLLLLGNAVVATRRSMRSVRALAGAALVIYAVVMTVTFNGNVPLNNVLATFTSLSTPIAAEAREQFQSTWNMLNLFRA